MTNDPYKLKDISNKELRAWVATHKADTDEYIAGIQESMRRVAVIEELMESKEAPSCRRECYAAISAALVIAVIIIAIVLTYE